MGGRGIGYGLRGKEAGEASIVIRLVFFTKLRNLQIIVEKNVCLLHAVKTQAKIIHRYILHT